MPDFDQDFQPIIKQVPREEVLPLNPSVPSYSSPFRDSQQRLDRATDGYSPLLQGMGEGENDSLIGDDVLKANQRYATYNPTVENQEDYKAEGQPGLSRLANAFTNVVGKTAAYTLQNTGFILGAPAAALTGDISNMTDNFLVKAGDALKDAAQENFPIYKTDKYSKGNIWDKLSSSSWWLDDAADRLALTVAMFVPGIAEAKGIGIAGLATKGLSAVAESPETYGWLGKTFLPKLFKAVATGTVDAGVNPALATYAKGLTRAELYSWNVIGQSALNGKETQEGIRKALQEQKAGGKNSLTDADIESKAADGAVKSFWETVPVTLAGSLVEIPQMFSTTQGAKSILNKLFNPSTGEALEENIGKSLWKTAGKAALTGLEHGQNESLQVAISRYNEDRATGKDVRGTVAGIFGDFLDNINDPNGQNNIALGTIQGLLMTVGGKGIERFTEKGKNHLQAEQQQTASLRNIINESKLARRYASGDFAQRNEDGSLSVDENGRVKMDQQKLSDAGVSLAGLQQSLQDKVEAIQRGDYLRAAQLDHDNLAGFAYNFFGDPNGMEHLTNLLKVEAEAHKVDGDRKNDIDEHGKEITPDIQLQRNLDTVARLKRAYDGIDQRHAGFTNLRVEGKDKEKTKAAQAFLTDLKHAQYQQASHQLFAATKLGRNSGELTSLRLEHQIPLEQEGSIKEPSNPAEERFNELIEENKSLEPFLQQAKEAYKSLINKEGQRKAFEHSFAKEQEIAKGVTQGKLRTTLPGEETGNFRAKFPEDSRTYSDIKAQYGQGEQSQKEVLGKILDSDYATASEKELAKKLLTLTEAKDTVSLDNSTLPVSGKIENGKPSINYEASASDFDKGHIPVEASLLSQIAKKYPQTIEDLNSSQAIGKEELQKEQEQISKARQALKALTVQSKELQTTSGTVSTPSPAIAEKSPTESSKKSIERLFTAGTFNTVDPKPHQKREVEFLSQLDFHPDRPHFKRVVVTKNNEESLGLKGLVDSLNPGEDNTDAVKGAIAFVYVKSKDGVIHFIDEKGDVLNKIGEQADNNKILAGVFPTASLTWPSSSDTRYSRANEQEAEAWSKAWQQRRQEIMDWNKDQTEYHDFNVSRGIGIVHEKINGKYERNPVVGTLIPKEKENLLNTQLVKVSTLGTIEHNGESINVPIGKPFFEYGSTLEFLNNRPLTESERETVFELLKKFSQEASEGKGLNRQYLNYLQGLLYFGTPKNGVVENNIHFDNGQWFFGKDLALPFSAETLERNREQVLNYLKDSFTNVNNTTLSRQGVPFEELYKEGEEIKSRSYPSYQHYLLQEKTPDGQTREIPLTTNLAKGQAYSYKYSWSPSLLTAPKEENNTSTIEEKLQEAPDKNTQGVQTAKTSKGEDIHYTASLDGDNLTLEIKKDEAYDRVYDRLVKAGKTLEQAEKAIYATAAVHFKSTMEASQEEENKAPVDVVDEQIAEFKKLYGGISPTDSQYDLTREQTPVVKEREAKKLLNYLAKKYAISGALKDMGLFGPYGEYHPRIGVSINKNTTLNKEGRPSVTSGEFISRRTIFHEYIHPFVRILADKNPALYRAIIKEAEAENSRQPFTDISHYSEENRQEELLVRYMDRLSDSDHPPSLVKRFIQWLSRLLFGNRKNASAKLEDLSLSTSVSELYRIFQNYGNLGQEVEAITQSVEKEIADYEKLIKSGTLDKSSVAFLNKVYLPQLRAQRDSKGLDQAKELSATDTYNIVQGLAGKIVQEMFRPESARSLIELDEKFQVGELMDKAFNAVYRDLAIGHAQVGIKIQQNRKQLEEKVIEYLRSKSISVEEAIDKEGDEADYGGRNADSYLQDAFTFDGKRSAPTSIKMLLSTIAQSSWENQTAGVVRNIRDEATHMIKMVNSSQVFNQTYSELAPLNSIDQKETKIVELAKLYPHYRILANRLKLEANYDALSEADKALRIKFFSTFSRQRPIAYTMVTREEQSFLQEANNTDAKKRIEKDWIDRLKSLGGPISYDADKGTYTLKKDSLQKETPRSIDQKIKFLSSLGINFSSDLYKKLSDIDQKKFSETVAAMHSVLSKEDRVATSTKSLGLESAYKTLSTLYIKTSGEAPESTFLNLEGERVQEFIQKNTITTVMNDINSSKSMEEVEALLPHLKEPYAQGSQYVNADTIGKTAFQVSYIQGVDNQDSDRYTTTEKLPEAARMLQEINANLNNHFYVMLPADSKTEGMLTVKPKFAFAETSQDALWDKVVAIFNGYYQVEKELHDSDGKGRILDAISPGYKIESLSKATVKEFLDQRIKEQKELLENYKLLLDNGDGTYSLKSLDKDFATREKLNKENLSKTDLYNVLLYRTLNYGISNIEFQKLFFGDPAAYGNLGNMLKRYKSFISPRETSLYGSEKYNTSATQEHNKSGEVPLQPGDPGYHIWKDHMATVTMEDVFSHQPSIVEDESLDKDTREAYKASNATDAQSWATLPGHKEYLVKNGYRWTSQDEAQYQYDMALDRQYMKEDGLLHKENYREALDRADGQIVEKGNPNSSFYKQVRKPVGSGYTLDNKPFLDKTSIIPLSYALVRGKTLATHYIKMLNQDISYLIVGSGRKVGNLGINKFYDEEGKASKEPYQNIIGVPFKFFGIQQETGGKKEEQTRGSQLTKLATINLLSGTVPIDYTGSVDQWLEMGSEEKKKTSPIYKEVAHNLELLREQAKDGYNRLVKKLGIEHIEQEGEKVPVVNKAQIARLLKDELFRREVADNLRDALQVDDSGEWTIPLEALNNYQQIKNILYSYVDKYIASPKLSGGPKVQVSGAGFEASGVRVKASTVNGKPVYVSSGLKFYENKEGKVTRMEVLLPNHWARQLREAGIDSSDIRLLPKELLEGIGFRIPTQELNSIEAFIIKGFIPEGYGDTIVVPEALTTKAGSDFDVDKLNTYLKNIYIDGNKKIHVIRLEKFSTDNEEKLKDFYEKYLLESYKKFKNKEELASISSGLSDVFSALDTDDSETQELQKQYVPTLEEFILQYKGKSIYQINSLRKDYTKALQNEYFDSLGRLLTLPQNYHRLVKPNSAEELKAIATSLVALAPKEFGDASVPSVLSPAYMSRARHEFLNAKGGIAIAAVNQTGNALNQLAGTFLDPARIGGIKNQQQKEDLGDASIKLPHNTIELKGKKYATLALIKDQKGNYISDGTSQHIDGFVDAAKGAWLSKIIQHPSLIGTHLILGKLGVPKDTVAYFMNQPIIREYIKAWSTKADDEFREDLVNKIYEDSRFAIGKQKVPVEFSKTSATYFSSLIQKFYGGKSLTQEEAAEQRLVLSEFFKYKALADNSFSLTQGTSYDTASFTDPNLIYLKEQKTMEAQGSNIFSSANNLLNASHIGETKDQLTQARDTIAQSIFQFDHPEVRQYYQNTINQLTHIRGTKDYLSAARKVEQSFIQYLSQLSTHLNGRINDLLVDTKSAITSQLVQLKGSSNLVVQQLKVNVGRSEKSTKNVSLFSKAYDIFTSNQYTAALRELKTENPSFYGNLLRAAFLQAGISQQYNSLTDIIPVEDFKNFLLPALRELNNPQSLIAFEDTDAFYRNNWRDSTIVPRVEQKWAFSEYNGGWYIKNLYAPKWLKDAGVEFAYKVSDKSAKFSSRFITVSRDVPGITKEQKAEMKRNGDYSYRQTILLRRVEEEDGTPLTQPYNAKNAKFGNFATYVPVFAWGDGNKAQEYYSDIRPSVLNNNTLQPKLEVDNTTLLNAFYNQGQKSQTSPASLEKLEFKEGPC